ncbi:hypothetical protein BGX26_012504 [Mortierella sp. AD094]|nr:hypothetical protein BGX26_012504 [Mortierella sp. AD094]
MTATIQKRLLQEIRPIYRDALGTITPWLKTINIDFRIDSKSDRYVVLWNDVKVALKTPLHVFHEDTAVSFLTDENLVFLQPLRILAYPDVVLDVVLETPGVGAGLESMPIKNPLNLESVSSTVSSYQCLMTTATTASTSGESEIHRTNRISPDQEKSLDDTLSSAYESIGRALQLILERNTGSEIHTYPPTERSNVGISDDKVGNIEGHDEQMINDNYEQGLAYYYESVLQGYSKAKDFFLMAASQGHIDARNRLESMFTKGLIENQNYVKALEWYQKAASQGNAGAQNDLGLMYLNGPSVTRDDSKAAELFQKAASQRHAIAQSNLGFMYDHGLGVTLDKSKSLEHYQKSASQGYADAQSNVGFLYRNGLGVTNDYSKAIDVFQGATMQGHTDIPKDEIF